MDFTDALRAQSLEAIQALPKSDLHSHAGRGGSQAYIARWTGHAIVPPRAPFADLRAMQHWFDANVKAHCHGLSGYLKRIEAAFVQAAEDSIAVLALSFGKDEVDLLGGIGPFAAAIDALHRRFAPGTRFLPELSLGREERPEAILDWLDDCLRPGWFRSIDVCNDELAQPIHRFIPVYEAARAYPVRRRAHVGEFGSAEDVVEAVEALGLDEVQHGIAAAASPWAMRWLADHRIRLNVCPTSNVMLGRARDLRTHPIRALYDHGVTVTVNTDDLLIFGSSVSQEFLRLYQAGTLPAGALEEIRQNGLDA